MSDRKPVYLLAGRGGEYDRIMRAVVSDIGRRSPTIAYVGAASEDNPEFFARIAATISGAGDCRVVHVLTHARNADIPRARETLEAADAIFVSGGDVEVGMQVLAQKGLAAMFASLCERGKLFFGVSAGQHHAGQGMGALAGPRR